MPVRSGPNHWGQSVAKEEIEGAAKIAANRKEEKNLKSGHPQIDSVGKDNDREGVGSPPPGKVQVGMAGWGTEVVGGGDSDEIPRIPPLHQCEPSQSSGAGSG